MIETPQNLDTHTNDSFVGGPFPGVGSRRTASEGYTKLWSQITQTEQVIQALVVSIVW